MNHPPPYSTPVAHHPPPSHQQHPLGPELGGAQPHFPHQQAPAAYELPRQLPAAAHQHPHYYQDPRAPPPPMSGIRSELGHTSSLPGLKDRLPETSARENGAAGTVATLKGETKETEGVAPHDPPKTVEKEDATRKYKLECVQQPQRARMCGFGDKDRRPITPPPCIRLVITDKATGAEVDCNKIEHQMYILAVDLWNAEGTREYNLVKHSTNSPSISSTTGASFRDLAEGAGGQYPPHQGMAGHGAYPAPPPPGMHYQQPMPAYGQTDSYVQNPYFNGQPAQQYNGGYGFRPDLDPNMARQLASQSMYGGRYPQEINNQRMGHLAPQAPNGMYTRNLIGSLVSSAARLTDPDDKIGIWFVLQDLSVRTEGWFRLRFSFVSVGLPNTQGDSSTSDPQRVNDGKAPILAQCFSEPFQVYSAKKFPGVCESTALSKCFALQGIKIPIRKEGQDGKGKKGSDDEDDY